MSEKAKKRVDTVVSWLIVGVFAFVGIMLIVETIEVESLKKDVKYQQEIYELWLDFMDDYVYIESKNEQLKNDIFWLKEIHKLELENATSNAELKKKIDDLKDYLDNYEDLMEVYVTWLKNNPNGTENEFMIYLQENHKWLYDWLTLQNGL